MFPLMIIMVFITALVVAIMHDGFKEVKPRTLAYLKKKKKERVIMLRNRCGKCKCPVEKVS